MSKVGLETRWKIASGEGSLGGIYAVPTMEPAENIVIIIPGSGNTDLNGNGPNLNSNTYKFLSAGLVEQGVATLRIDKRGIGSSASALRDANNVTISDYADDIQQWIIKIRNETRIPNIWIAGHSEGGLVALVAAQMTNEISGLILLASAGRPIGKVLCEQMERHLGSGDTLEIVFSTITKLESGHHVDVSQLPNSISAVFAPQIQNYLISWLSYNPVELLRCIKVPTLVVHGTKDLQVSTLDADLLSRANNQAELVQIANMNHVLKDVLAVDRIANFASYQNPGQGISSVLLDRIVQYIGRAAE